MFPLEGLASSSMCEHPPTILYGILSRRGGGRHGAGRKPGPTAHCHCEHRRAVCLTDPKASCRGASAVLVKTVCFMRSLPSFSQLPPPDHLSLLRHCWVPVFVVGLAQERIVFEVTGVPNSSILRQILLGAGLAEKEASQPTLAEVRELRTCLHQLWNLELSPKEYAYLKGALLFNPAAQGLSAELLVRRLQREAWRALQEVAHLLHPEDAARFSHILLAASAIQTVSHNLVTELFFRPVIGNKNMFHLLTEMFVH